MIFAMCTLLIEEASVMSTTASMIFCFIALFMVRDAFYEGRTVLSYSRLSWLEGGKVVTRTVAPDEVDSVLREVFGLVR